MRLERIMSRRPLVVSPETTDTEVASLARAARVRHLPVMDGDRLAGIWVVPGDGGPRLLGPDEVGASAPEVDAEEAIGEILDGRQAVIAFEDGTPVGMLTRTDVLAIIRAALAHGHGAVPEGPVDPAVVVLTGPAGAGTSTLLTRTLPLLHRCETGVVRADVPDGTPPTRTETAGVTTIVDPAAAFRRGLHESVRALGDVQIVLVEDRDRPPGEPGVPGGDTQVLVVGPDVAAGLSAGDLRDTQAVVVTRLDEAPAGFDLDALRRRLAGTHPGLPVFGVAAGHDDRGLAEWGEWLLGRALPRAHR